MHRFALTLLLAAVLQCNRETRGFYELVEELGCQDTEFRLICGRLDARIAIIEAAFSRNDSAFEPMRATCGNRRDSLGDGWRGRGRGGALKPDPAAPEVSFRHAINRRCSGVNYCSFILAEDHAPSVEWGSGSVYLRYACMDDARVLKSCVADVDARAEGFVQSPGYPKFYVGGRTCRWSLRARPGQTVKIDFLDISIRGTAPFESDCVDFVAVTESGFDRLKTCGDAAGDVEITSSGPAVNVTLTSRSRLIFPKRGLLFRYKVVGCLAPGVPRNGYLAFRNESRAHFRCTFGHVFPDTLSRDRIINCNGNNSWDGDVPNCIRGGIRIIDSVANSSEQRVNYLRVNYREEKGFAAMDEVQGSNVKDVVVPSIIMTVIFIGNAFIILVILHYRKKLDISHCRKASHAEAEENELKAAGNELGVVDAEE